MAERSGDPVVERLAGIEDRLTRVEDGLTRVEKRLAKVDDRLTRVEGRLARVESDVAWLKQLYRGLDRRVWFIVGGIIVTILVSLLA